MSDAHDRPPVVGIVVVAAGMGTRLGAGLPKALVPVGGRTLVEHAVRAARGTRGLGDLVVVVPPGHRAGFAALDLSARLVDGGRERTDSVAAGLAALDAAVDIVLVHDAARAFAPTALFDQVVDAVAGGADAAVPGLPVVDTIKRVDADGVVRATPPRGELRAVQTPQGFTRDALARAHGRGAQATDDAALVEAAGGRVRVVPGHPDAYKVTTPQDLARAHAAAGPGRPVLVALAGLPGAGKSTIATALARRAGLVHVRIDSIEQAMRDSGELERPAVAGYAVGYALAADQLARGLSVVADTVNPLPVTRDGWARVARRHDARLLQVEVVCADAAEHERRVTTRAGDIPGLPLPDWAAVRTREYAAHDPDLRIDTARLAPAAAVDLILEAIAR